MSEQHDPVISLKSAMLERAHKLAEEHRAQGDLSRQKILQEARATIQRMEQHELAQAKTESEREYRRQVEEHEIRLQAEMDRNRWELMQKVMDDVVQALQHLQQDEPRYRPVLLSLLEQGARLIDSDNLVAHLNAADHQRFQNGWPALCERVTQKKIMLSETTIQTIGGIKLISAAGDVMLDNTFEGLLERQRNALHKVVFGRLFASAEGTGVRLHG